jgi:hypothetical protein
MTACDPFRTFGLSDEETRNWRLEDEEDVRRKAWRTPSIIFGLVLAAWPFAAFSVVFLLDDPSVPKWWDATRTYIVFSTLFYPIVYLVSTTCSYVAYKYKKPGSMVFALASIPILTGCPWFVVFLCYLLLVTALQ